ncbi:YuzF family protein [Alkalihalobacillus sp. MEB203]|uniref:YuzF family protein n=2 Tax=Alkalihalobacterium chitinilyticum TaxID=2980103 RepID=A0ABT5VND4_9BACI|nr:YuzF family protein [Alkalihalobacterium chitinilyticum]MDE5416262.1 YuzF family protein [Alkalihalobacterium chitinilyticum]
MYYNGIDYTRNHHQHQNHQTVQQQMITLYDPYVVQVLQSVKGKELVVETSRGSIRGNLTDVKPDHIVLSTNDSSFFVRIQEIIWVMPN